MSPTLSLFGLKDSRLLINKFVSYRLVSSRLVSFLRLSKLCKKLCMACLGGDLECL